MSWFFGAFGHLTDEDIRSFNSHKVEDCHIISRNELYLIYGGLNDLLITHTAVDSASGWIVCGRAISQDGNKYLNIDDWAEAVSLGKNYIHSLNGHFIFIAWSDDEVNILTDRSGVREVHYFNDGKKTLFSTNLNLINLYLKEDLDLSVLGSIWMLDVQVNHKSLLKNSQRLLSAGELTLNHHSPMKSSTRLYNSDNKTILNDQEFDDLLIHYAALPLKSATQVSFGLSGGIDSRAVLAMLLSQKAEFCTHTFGSPYHPDSIIAGEIANLFDFDHEQFDMLLPDSDELVEELISYTSSTRLIVPCSEYLQQRFYPQMYSEGKFVVDAGMGEICRRSYFNKLRLFGKNALLKNDTKKLFRLLSSSRVNIFSEDVVNQMQAGCYEQIDELMNIHPKIQDVGIDKWLSMLYLRYFVSNKLARELNRIDSFALSYTPFLQPGLWDAVFSTDESNIINAKSFRRIIHKFAKSSEKIPLIKDGIFLPYNLNEGQRKFILRIKKKFGLGYLNSHPVLYLVNLKEYVLDILNSKEFLDNPYYNHKLIQESSDEFYKGQSYPVDTLDWWLTFHLYSKCMNI